jgi:hypothetical protein
MDKDRHPWFEEVSVGRMIVMLHWLAIRQACSGFLNSCKKEKVDRKEKR